MNFFCFTLTVYFVWISTIQNVTSIKLFQRNQSTTLMTLMHNVNDTQQLPEEARCLPSSSYQIINLMFPAGLFTSNGNWTDWASGRNFQSGSNPKFSALDSRCTQNCTKYDSGSSRVLKSSVASKFFSRPLVSEFVGFICIF